MAITRAQIAKQLLEQGGRVGLQGGGADMGTVSTPSRAARDNREIGARMARTASSGQGDAMRRNQEAFQTAVGVSDLERLQKEGVPDLNLGITSILLNSEPVKKFRNFVLNKNIERYKNVTQGPYTLQGYKDYMKDMRDRFTSDDNDNNQSMLPQTMFAQAPSITEQEPELTELQQMLEDTPKYRFAAEGGIMNNDVVGGEFDFETARQAYGLGKLVKKVTRTVKKIAKSPIGKAALIGMAGFGIPGTSFGGLLGRASFGGAAPGIFGTFGPTSALKKLGIMKSEMIPGVLERTGPLSKLGIGSAIMGASALSGLLTAEQEEQAQQISDETGINIEEIRANPDKYLAPRFMAEGGSTEGKEPVAKKVMPLIDMDGKEKDYRETGGFVDMGRMEKADDVPARLSKNEFVFTADAVRNAGDGSVDKGAEVMYNMMKNLEAGGDVSEESQGLEGARKMFQTSQRLEEVL